MTTELKNNTIKSSVNGTDDREACSSYWYAARTQINCERKVLDLLKDKITDSYIPIQDEIHQWSDRKQTIHRIVIPMIVFVKMNKSTANAIHRQSYFYGLLKNPGENFPSYIPEEQIQHLKFMMENSDTPVTFESMPLHIGDKVRVVTGRLKGLEGNVLIHDDGTSSVVLNLNILGCALVKIDQKALTLI
jgi:transcription antitermination factor NusG